MIKIAEISKKTDKELEQFITEQRAALAQAIVDSRTKEVKQVKIEAAHKRAIARALTVAREREIAKMEAAS